MAVFRIEKTRDYTVMSNHHLRNAGLSLKSKGLLSMMLSLPEDWNYTTRGLAKICKEGTDSIGSALKELERAGYIVRNRLRDSKGKIADVEYVLYEMPHPLDTGQPCEDEPDTTCPDTENPVMDHPFGMLETFLAGSMEHEVTLGSSVYGNFQRLDHVIERLTEEQTKATQELESTQRQLEFARQEVTKEFPQEEELQAKQARLQALNIELSLDQPDTSAAAKRSGRQIKNRRRNLYQSSERYLPDSDKSG